MLKLGSNTGNIHGGDSTVVSNSNSNAFDIIGPWQAFQINNQPVTLHK